MSTTTESPKQAKADQIVQCSIAIGKYFRVRAQDIASKSKTQSPSIMDARALLIYHLYDCGMGYAPIGKMMGRSVSRVRHLESAGAVLCMNPATMACVKALPRIPSTLTITAVPPVTEA
jgi:hypothetical protein